MDRVYESNTGFDTGSSAILIFPNELRHILVNTANGIPTMVKSATGGMMGRLYGIISTTEEEYFPWLRETAVCLGPAKLRLSGHTL